MCLVDKDEAAFKVFNIKRVRDGVDNGTQQIAFIGKSRLNIIKLGCALIDALFQTFGIALDLFNKAAFLNSRRRLMGEGLQSFGMLLAECPNRIAVQIDKTND